MESCAQGLRSVRRGRLQTGSHRRAARQRRGGRGGFFPREAAVPFALRIQPQLEKCVLLLGVKASGHCDCRELKQHSGRSGGVGWAPPCAPPHPALAPQAGNAALLCSSAQSALPSSHRSAVSEVRGQQQGFGSQSDLGPDFCRPTRTPCVTEPLPAKPLALRLEKGGGGDSGARLRSRRGQRRAYGTCHFIRVPFDPNGGRPADLKPLQWLL